MEKVKLYFEDLTINSNYQLLEWGKDDDELSELAIKKGLQVPSKDLAFFKCVYAMVDKANKNKCTLPRKEVKKALKSLNGKAIDKDHLRKATIGHWLQAELEDNDIIAYGCFWKSNFPEEYEIIKGKMEEGKVKVSFEAWGERKFKEDGKHYDLTGIEFAGGALLFDTEPAFPDAEVLDFSSKREEVLEFARIIEEGNYNCECIKCGYKETSESHCKDNTCPKCGGQMRRAERPGSGDPSSQGESMKTEDAKFYCYPEDMAIIDRLLYETECPSCKKKAFFTVSSIDFDKSIVKVNCNNCKAKYSVSLEPETTLEKKGKKIKEMSKIDENTNQEGGSRIMDKYLEKYQKATIDEVISLLESEIETVKASIAEKEKSVGNLTTEVENAKAEIEKIKTEKEQAITEATEAKEKLDAKLAEEKAAIIKTRKDELGEEFAKDMNDEDIMDDLKFELAKTKKELAKLKSEKGSITTGSQGLEAGSSDNIEPVFKKQTSIRERAFGKDSE